MVITVCRVGERVRYLCNRLTVVAFFSLETMGKYKDELKCAICEMSDDQHAKEFKKCE